MGMVGAEWSGSRGQVERKSCSHPWECVWRLFVTSGSTLATR